MTKRAATRRTLRLLAVWLGLQAAFGATRIPHYWDLKFETLRLLTAFFAILSVIMSAVIGALLWTYADRLGGRFFPERAEESQQLACLHQAPLFARALAVMGVLLLCEALPVIVNGLALFPQSRIPDDSVLGDVHRMVWRAHGKARMLSGTVRLLVGLALLAGPVGLSAAYARVRVTRRRTLGDEETASEEEPRG